MTSTRQKDGKISVVVVMAHPDGDRRFVAIVDDKDAFYAHCRDMVDNPEPIDYEAERVTLVEQRASLDTDIATIDQKIIDRDAETREVPK